MPRLLDTYDSGKVMFDEGGTELPVVRSLAMSAMPKIAADEIPADRDRQHLGVLATGEDGHPVYSATLNDTGLRLLR